MEMCEFFNVGWVIYIYAKCEEIEVLIYILSHFHCKDYNTIKYLLF